MKRVLPTTLALLSGALLLFHGCGSSSNSTTACTPRAERSCSCPEQSSGTQVCADDGSSYGGCRCAGGSPDGTVIVNASAHNTVLGRPTDRSIAVSVLAASAGDSASVEWSATLDAAKTALVSPTSTAPVTSASGEPIVLEVTGLAADTQYFYRVVYTAKGGAAAPDALHSFRTQRAPGRSFSFGVQGDTHPERYSNKMFHPELFTLTMEQVRDRQPDLYFMLGDDFSAEKIIQDFKEANYGAGHKFYRAVEGSASYATYQSLPHPFLRTMLVDGEGAPQGYAQYRSMRESFLGVMANATALMLVNGNHEQAHSANLGGVFNNAAVWAADGRLKYYPLPGADGFYSGDERRMSPVNGYPTIAASDGLLRDYYAFTWGDALFVTVDPYWHSDAQSPDTPLYDGDKEQAWVATMGDEQYAWLKRTLEQSTAKWKFVFAHHVNGTGRGAAAVVPSSEWGGKLSDFQSKRPTWEKSIHQLLADTKVTVFFQGHDHIFSREVVDGVVYQSIPNPADNSYFAYNCDAYDPDTIRWQGAAGYGKYDPDYGVRLPNSGYVHVTVSAEVVRLDYVRTYRAIDLQTNPNGIFKGTEKNGEIAFSYSIPPQPGDGQAKDANMTCMGAAPPAGWVYNP